MFSTTTVRKGTLLPHWTRLEKPLRQLARDVEVRIWDRKYDRMRFFVSVPGALGVQGFGDTVTLAIDDVLGKLDAIAAEAAGCTIQAARFVEECVENVEVPA